MFAFVALISLHRTNAADQNKYEIKIKINGIKEKYVKLAYYFGNNTYLKDSAKADSKGNIVFKGKEVLDKGIYILVLPNKNYFEFVVDNQFFSLETDTLDLTKNMKVKNSPENVQFFDYLKFIAVKGKAIDSLSKVYNTQKDTNKEESEKTKTKIIELDKQVKDFRESYIKNNPTALMANVFNAMKETEVPEPPVLSNGRKDSLWQFKYYRAHFWDSFNFADDRLVRTPVYAPKLKRYIEELTLQAPDSLNKAADFILEKTKSSKDLFKFTLFWITYNYETSKLMGADGVFVHLAEEYYMKNKAYWLDSAQNAKIKEKAMRQKPLLIGKIAPNISMYDMKTQPFNLHDVKSKFTAVYFWDPDCGHCQKVTPVLKNKADTLAVKGLKVFGVCMEADQAKVKTNIEKYKIESWINVNDPYNTSGFRSFYDISSTPQLFLLNEKKEIIAKQITPEQLEEIINSFK